MVAVTESTDSWAAAELLDDLWEMTEQHAAALHSAQHTFYTHKQPQ